MDSAANRAAAAGQAVRRLGGATADTRLRQAAWLAPCYGVLQLADRHGLEKAA